ARVSRLRVPGERLPAHAAVRHNILRTYFCDKDAAAELTDGEWILRLSWPSGEERHVDPRLDIGLAWWGDGITRETMAIAQKRQGRVLSALYDTWTLHSWSERLGHWRG